MAGISGEINHKRYHLIGIGGIGMSGIAKLLLEKNISVSGSDLKETEITNSLKKLGADIFIGHNRMNVGDAGVIVYSSAIKKDNPELIEAGKRGLPLIKRAQALAQLMQDKTVITVTGSHGKTTTTSLVSCLLLEAGFNPTFAVGGLINNIDTNCLSGKGSFFVAEADESDGSFLYYRPKYSIITNVDYEHLDYYRDFPSEVEAFRRFAANTQPGGCLFLCGDDATLKNIARDIKGTKVIFFGLNNDADIYPRSIKIDGLASEFDCFFRDDFIGRFRLEIGGRHNISNALPVIALGRELGIDLRFIQAALGNYKGAKRRLEIKLKTDGLIIIDDYAHHPTEIKATLAAAINLKSKRLIAVFQPHRYTRTKLLMHEFVKSFDFADCVYITDIYAASEPPLAGVTAKGIYEGIKKYFPGKEAYFLPKEELAKHILKIIRPGDTVITLGAGDITKVSDELVAGLKK